MERAGQGEVGGCTRRVQTAWPCLGSAVERSWSAHGLFFSYSRLPFLGRLDCKFVNWWAWYKLSIAEITCVSGFEPSNAREQKLGYVVFYILKMT